MNRGNAQLTYNSPNMNFYQQSNIYERMSTLRGQNMNKSTFQPQSDKQNSSFFKQENYFPTQPYYSQQTYNPNSYSKSNYLSSSTRGSSISSYQLNRNESVSLATSLAGLQNLGNTCFMNTCLQNLLHTELFISKLVDNKNAISFQTPITKLFYDLCMKIQTSSYAISPIEFKRDFGKRHPSFQGYGQHDTQEFCRVLLEDISAELNRVKGPTKYKELNSDNMNKMQSTKAFDEIFRRKEDSIIIDTFYGQIINIFRCPCSKESYSHEKLLDIPLLLPANSNAVNVQSLLDNYFEFEYIQWETKCSNCGHKTAQRKEVFFSQLPEILILSFQRNNGRTKRKNNIDISFDKDLNLMKYSDKDCIRDQSTKYELYGIGHHIGTMDFGHYIAEININGNWFVFNDSSVEKSFDIKRRSNSVYVLFYKKL